ncbi:MAG: cytochrome c biogenesis CcdA family protein [Bacteriovoracaceae bacterium]
MLTQYSLGFVAGGLSLLAPCVLPLIPIIFGSSLRASKLGPFANALGLTFSFTLVGILTSLFSSIFNVDVIQKVGAVILVIVGLVFIIPKLKDSLTDKLSFVSNKGNQLQGKVQSKGVWSEFLMGSLLGIIWGPCSGPTLAFAFGIATQAERAFEASMIFFFFGLGAGLGLVSLGLLLRKFSGLIGFLMKHNKLMNSITGATSIIIGLMIMTGSLADFEELIIQHLPNWFVQLSTSI